VISTINNNQAKQTKKKTSINKNSCDLNNDIDKNLKNLAFAQAFIKTFEPVVKTMKNGVINNYQHTLANYLSQKEHLEKAIDSLDSDILNKNPVVANAYETLIEIRNSNDRLIKSLKIPEFN